MSARVEISRNQLVVFALVTIAGISTV